MPFFPGLDLDLFPPMVFLVFWDSIPKRCKGVHCVDLGESFPTSIYLQKSASIQPRTSPSKFGEKFNSLFTSLLSSCPRPPPRSPFAAAPSPPTPRKPAPTARSARATAGKPPARAPPPGRQRKGRCPSGPAPPRPLSPGVVPM